MSVPGTVAAGGTLGTGRVVEQDHGLDVEVVEVEEGPVVPDVDDDEVADQLQRA